MSERADVVVVGGGVVGASVAYHLAARGCTDVLVLDRDLPGSGSTGRATGGYRAQFATPVNVRLSLLAREKLRAFPEELGVDAGYRPCGYLFVATSDAQLTALCAAQAVQRDAGLDDVRTLDADEVRALNPAVHGDDVVGGVFGASDGFIRPLQVMHGYLAAARRLGARVESGRAVRALLRDGARIVGVETDAGPVHAGAVVNAAGAWAADLIAGPELTLPVVPVQRQTAVTVPTACLPGDMPMTIFVEDGFHLRVRDGRVLFLRSGSAAPPHPGGPVAFDDGWLPPVLERARQRVPAAAAVPIDRAACIAGLYEMSPDGHAILGAAPGLDGLWLANGSSGHGVMHAPALGHLLAELIVDGAARTMDVRPLRSERFAEGDANRVPDLF